MENKRPKPDLNILNALKKVEGVQRIGICWPGESDEKINWLWRKK